MLINTQSLALALGMSVKSVLRMVATNRIPYYAHNGDALRPTYRFDLNKVLKSLDGQKYYMDYLSYLESPAWQAKRQELFAARGRQCESCGSNAEITVHHLTYARLGRELLSDLEVLCWPCHSKLDGVSPAPTSPTIKYLPPTSKRVALGRKNKPAKKPAKDMAYYEKIYEERRKKREEIKAHNIAKGVPGWE